VQTIRFRSVLAPGLFLVIALPAQAQSILPDVVVRGARETPLNTDSPADSASRLSLKVRDIPATVEVLDQDTIKARGYRSVSEAAQGAVGMLAGDAPGAPANFSMRGFGFSQLNTLYNGIKIGPPGMTSRMMDTGNLERIEFLKGPASLMSGEGASGGAVNYVTKRPHSGPVENEAYASYGSFDTWRTGFGSGGSTSKEGLDYRFDLTSASSDGFIHDTPSTNWHLSSGLDYRVSGAFKVFGAFEAKYDRNNAYWGTPLVPLAASGGFATNKVVSGNHVSSFNGSDLGAVTIDSRTLKTNYNVLDNRNEAEQYWLRGGFAWNLSNSVTLRNQLYYFTAKREFLNSEVYAFNAATGLVDHDRFYVAHDQTLVGNKAELQWDTRLAGMDNRMVAAFDVSKLHFDNQQAANFPSDSVTLVNPDRGTYGPLVIQRGTAHTDNVALAVEDRLKLSPTLALVGGVRYEEISLERIATNAAGAARAGFPFSNKWHPVTGRAGVTWEAMPGFVLYGQYATAADVAANNLFALGPLQPSNLTRSRTYEVGVRHLLWQRQAEWSLALYDIERKNVYVDQSGHALAVAGKQNSRGAEFALGLRPIPQWNLWGNVAYTRARYEDYFFAGGDFSGHTPPNVPHIIANAGTSYRFGTPTPLEVGAAVRHVGDRFNSDLNNVKMLAYTVGDAYAAVDVRKTRLALRVRNLTNEKYAIWADPGYPDQILLGAPRSYELSATMRF